MIRVYFVYEDPLDEVNVNLSFIDVPTRSASKALRRVSEAATSGELWTTLYGSNGGDGYRLIESKMTYLNITAVRGEWSESTLLPI